MTFESVSTGEKFESTNHQHKDLPKKEKGKHRWVAASLYKIDQETAERSSDITIKLDNDNYLSTQIGCWDCDMLLMNPNDARTYCPAKAVEFL